MDNFFRLPSINLVIEFIETQAAKKTIKKLSIYHSKSTFIHH